MAEDSESNPLSDSEKAKVAADLIQQTPPGGFNDVFNDVRTLLNNDELLKDSVSGAFSQYNKDQLTPVKIEGSEFPGLITQHNDLGGGRFADARSKQSFKYDHLRAEALEFESWEPETSLESLRSAIEAAVTEYCQQHYKSGVASTFSKKPEAGDTIVCCIENHQFQPKNMWNGRWRSEWSIVVSRGQAEVTGDLKVHVHYYESGNVQLVSSKEVKKSITMGNDSEVAKNLVKMMEDEETEYQTGISENYQTMSDTLVKALRRQLPVTRTKIDWSKITQYGIGKDLKSI